MLTLTKSIDAILRCARSSHLGKIPRVLPPAESERFKLSHIHRIYHLHGPHTAGVVSDDKSRFCSVQKRKLYLHHYFG